MEINSRDYREAKKKVKRKKGFRSHFSVYLSVSVFLILLNVFTGGGEFWAIFPILSWGLGVFIHYTNVHGFPGLKKLDKEWERDEIKRELRNSYRERQLQPRKLLAGNESPDFEAKEDTTTKPDHQPQELELEDLDELLDLIEEKEKLGGRK